MQISDVRNKLLEVRRLKESILSEMNFDYSKVEINSNKLNASFKRNFTSLKSMKMACIMDEFTYNCFKYECELFQLTPKNWNDEMLEFQPDMLFVESAWRGKDELWNTKVAHLSDELIDLISYCNKNNIPVVLWNKEDPVHFDVFIETAKYADLIFTTDFDSIIKYKNVLKRDDVYLLPFAAQPAIHNPIEEFDRKDAYSFAGAYYKRFPERIQNLETFVDVISERNEIEIFDRNFNNSDPNYEFPLKYNRYIKGYLPASEINKAYKGYKYSVNMNSVKSSQSMCARRIFELLASNTITVSNYSRAIRNFFGDLVVCTDDEKNLRDNIIKLQDEQYYNKLRLKALRKVYQEHLYEDRLRCIVNRVFSEKIEKNMLIVNVFCAVSNHDELSYVIEQFDRQEYAHKHLFIYSKELSVNIREDITILKEINQYTIDVVKNDNSLIAFFSIDDYYGKFYLTDFALANRYQSYLEVPVKTKSSYYVCKDNKISNQNSNTEYKMVEKYSIRQSVIHSSLVDLNNLPMFVHDINNTEMLASALSIDSMNYCQYFKGNECEICDDLVIVDQGINMDVFDLQVNNTVTNDYGLNNWSISTELFELVNNTKNLTFTRLEDGVVLKSNVLRKSESVYLTKRYTRSELPVDNTITIQLECEYVTGLNVELVLIGYDDRDKKLETHVNKSNKAVTIHINKQSTNFEIGFKIVGVGEAKIKQIMIKKLEDAHSLFIPKSNILLISNHYPSYDNLYFYAFVHTRLSAYKRSGMLVDMFRLNDHFESGYSEFSGMDIYTGNHEQLQVVFQCAYQTILIHFLDQLIWDGIKDIAKDKKIIVWVHGSDIQPWWRRMCNFNNEQDIEDAKGASHERMKFWQHIFALTTSNTYNFHFVFVSENFKDQVFEDCKLDLSEDRYSIIHNFIDSELYQYAQKDSEMRKKILSIRPFATTMYANDQSAKAIIELSKEKFFNELEFRIVGSGIQFDKITKPLRKYTNVIIDETFLRHDEIAKLHKDYGIFLVPTRNDTQGVSRDEAMSSGLVPITTNITAVPEFVDEKCGLLVEPEDYIGLAKAIKYLYENPNHFTQLSHNAAQRVRQQSSFDQTILKEIKLIKEGNK